MVQNIRRTGAAMAVAVAGLGALFVGCGASGLPAAQTQAFAAAAPISIACEANQRAVVRQIVVNGVPQAQAECVSIGAAAPVAYMTGPAAQPVSYMPGAGYLQAPIPNTQFVNAPYVAPPVTRAIAPRQIVERPVRRVVRQPKRSVAKSAVIIGSSAGVGAGVGALVGGKKGAGIGALVGGGGAALWDQLTRRK